MDIWEALPIYYMAIRPSFSWVEQPLDAVYKQNLRTKSYKLVSVSGGIAFYDRVVDVTELEPR